MSRDWQKDMELCKRLNEWYEHEWQAGQEELSTIISIYEILPDEPCNFVADCENDLTAEFIVESRQALPYWLQQYAAEKERADKLELSLKATEGLTRAETKRADGWREHVRKLNIDLEYAEAREQTLREAMEWAIKETSSWDDPEDALDEVMALLRNKLASLYPKEETKPAVLEEGETT